MSLKVPQASALRILDSLMGFYGDTLLVDLFTNNITPGNTDVIGDYTIAAFTGYAQQTATSWTAAATVSGRAQTQADLVTFSNTDGSGHAVYGYVIRDPSGNLLWAERDGNAPVTIPATTGTYILLPRFTLKSEF